MGKVIDTLKNKKEISIPYIEIVVTTKCTLNCKDCANLMQYYHNPYIIDVNTLKTSIKKLIKAVDNIDKFRILGGEPFLHPNLDEIINIVARSEKIKKVEIATNGTILPKKESLIESLKNDKVNVSISDYGKLSTKKDEILKLGIKHNFKVSTLDIDYWLDYSSIECRNKDNHKLINQYKKCNHQCTSILNGKIFDCPRSAHAMDLGITKESNLEYIDLLDSKKSIATTKKEILEMYNGKRKSIQACNYCDVGCNAEKIEPAIQLNLEEKARAKQLII